MEEDYKNSSESEVDEPSLPTPTKKLILPLTTNPEIMKAEGELQSFIWDTQAWGIVVTECRKLPIEDARRMMDRVMQQFPSYALYWSDYAQMEFSFGDKNRGFEILKSTLFKYPSEHLWRLYLNTLHHELEEQMKFNSTNKEKMNIRVLRENLRCALSEAQKRFGFTLSSKFIWDMSIDLAKKAKSDVNTFRDIYKKVLSLPIYDLESIWEDYKSFEKLNDEIGKRKIIELNNKFDPTKKILRDKNNIWKLLHVDAPAVPPLGSSYEKEQLQTWRRAIQFELENHEGISHEELCFRMRTIFTQCLCVMRYHPDMWYEFAMFEKQYGSTDFALNVLNEACQIIPESLYLHFCYADFLESEKKILEAEVIYENLIATQSQTIIYIVYQRFLLRNKSLNEVRLLFNRAIHDSNCGSSIYVATATIEYYFSHNIELARRIFQVGYKFYHKDPEFILGYTEFLSWIGDYTNIHLLLTNALNELDISQLTEICRKYLHIIQYKNDPLDNLSHINELEARWCQSRPNNPSFQGLLSHIHRYEQFGMSSLSDIDISLKERYYTLTDLPLGYDKLENRVIPKRENSLLKSNLIVGDVPDFIANWIKNLPEGRETEVSSDLLIDLILKDMKEMEYRIDSF